MKTAQDVKREIIKDFVNFLKINNAYTQYRANIANSFYPTQFVNFFYNGFVTKVLKDHKYNYRVFNLALVDNFINFAFTWSCTPQGDYFWRKLSEKWQTQVYQKYRKTEIINILKNG